MFPLGTVLLPYMPLTLHVFEPRYRVLLRDAVASNGEFGVVLIERGNEVGGGDTRFDVGTVARLVEVAELPDGRSLLLAVGTSRFTVREWLPEDPYPRAMVVPHDDDASGTAISAASVDAATRAFERVLTLCAELGELPESTWRLSGEPARLSFEMAGFAPLGPLDRQRVLATADPAGRMELVREMLDEQAEVLEHRVRGQHG